MTPTAIIALVKDVVILIAAGLAVYLCVSYGKDFVKIADMKALQVQLTQNALTETQWRKEQTDANTKRDTDLAKVADTIAGQRAPVYIMRGPASSGAVPNAACQASGPPASAGRTDAGRGSDRQPVDLRPQVNAFELKYETAIADCRAALDQWPH
jgi:hypothetical protein